MSVCLDCFQSLDIYRYDDGSWFFFGVWSNFNKLKTPDQ